MFQCTIRKNYNVGKPQKMKENDGVGLGHCIFASDINTLHSQEEKQGGSSVRDASR